MVEDTDMSRTSSNILFKCFYRIIWMIFFAKALSLTLTYMLPNQFTKDIKITQNDFREVALPIKRVFHLYASQNKKKIIKTKTPTLLIKDMILKGIYVDKNNSFAVIALKKKKNDVKIVSKGEIFNGYKVIKIYPKKIILQKDGQLYTLFLDLQKDKSPLNDAILSDEQSSSIILKSEDVYKYANNFDKIWKEIRIDDVRKGGKLKGFIIRWIKPHSIFSKIGLRKNDKIIKVNGKILDSYAVAFDYYKRLKKKMISVLRLTIVRNNKEKEIEYEMF